MKILVMGHSGSGKTKLSKEILEILGADKVAYFNADHVRKIFDDWDFSPEARIRSARRMYCLCKVSNIPHQLADFICPTAETREIFKADIIIWVDTVTESQYTDTNKLFETPEHVDYHVTTKDATKWALEIVEHFKLNEE